MTQRQICISCLKSLISILLILAVVPAQAQRRKTVEEPDSTPLFNGVQIMADLVGPIQMAVSDYGQWEVAARVNLKDKYFPVIELGYGKANHDEEASSTAYKTKAPYGRIGCDFNVLKNKHRPYRAFVGLRYAYTSFKTDVERAVVTDPVWKTQSHFLVTGNKCYYHWLELTAGIDAKVYGPIHLGWSVRYKRRIKADEGLVGNAWYVPGFGISNKSRLGGTFNIIIDLLWKNKAGKKE